MARGNEAKKSLMDKIISILSDCYVGEVDKKYYFNSMENGEQVQICLSMTCPKIPIESKEVVDAALTKNFDWSGDNAAPAPAAPVEISKEDDAAVEELMRRLEISDD